MSERNGNWKETVTGRQFWPLDPRPEDVCIEDIGHALGNMCRYTGHCTPFYSVAQHSVIVSFLVPQEHALWGLLHDAAEAYLVDVDRPTKGSLYAKMPWADDGQFVCFADLESNILFVIALALGLPWPPPPEVKAADSALQLAEREQLMPRTGRPWSISGEPAKVAIYPQLPEDAQRGFFLRYEELAE